MIEAKIYLDSWVSFDEEALAWQGQITGNQAKELIEFADHHIYELKLSPIGISLHDDIIETPTNKIKELLIMANLEWYNEGKGYLTKNGAILYSALLYKLKEETK